MTVTRPRPDAYREPAPSRTPPTPPTRARATANGAGRTPGTAVGSARRPAPTTR
ncbi:MAG: hypothetical protein QOE93_960, partial [Actinomycetota bacterium]|nr:hypothetical protein [Actinomycetota bacterium]